MIAPILFAMMSTLGLVAVAQAADTTRETRTRAKDTAARAKRKARRKRHAKPPKKPPKPDSAPVSKGLREPHTVKVAPAAKKKKKGRRRKLTPKRAALRLYAYVSTTISAGKARTLGSKGAPNAKVRRYQRAMGGLVADGIYGPKTRARGKALSGRTFPRRQKRASSRRTTTPRASSSTEITKQPAPAPPRPEATDDDATGDDDDATGDDVILASTAPTAAVDETPDVRSKKRAALDLMLHARGAPSGDGRGAWFGYRDHPNAIVLEAQRDMGGLTSDGIYGPNTRARGKELTGQDFPRR